MRSGWFFCFSTYDPIEMVIQPEWPLSLTPDEIAQIGAVVYDVRRLDSGAAPADHPHQVMGTIAFVNDDLADGHYHYIQFYGNQWHQTTMEATPHDHPYQVGGINDIRFLPDYFCLFAWCLDDTIFDALVADSKWYLIGESIVTLDTDNNQWVFGDIDNTAFTPTQINQWTTRFRAALGREMPVEITNPRRLVSWFCPQSAPNMYDWWAERLFRPTSQPYMMGASTMMLTVTRDDGELVELVVDDGVILEETVIVQETEPAIRPPIISIYRWSLPLCSETLWSWWLIVQKQVTALFRRK